MTYQAPVREMQFFLGSVLGTSRLADTDRFAEATEDMAEAILTEAARLSAEVLAPINRAGDEHPARLENGVVRTSPGFAEAYSAIAEGGWVGISGGAPATRLTCCAWIKRNRNRPRDMSCPNLAMGSPLPAASCKMGLPT